MSLNRSQLPHRAPGPACILHNHGHDILKTAFSFGDCTKWTFRKERINWEKNQNLHLFLGSVSHSFVIKPKNV